MAKKLKAFSTILGILAWSGLFFGAFSCRSNLTSNGNAAATVAPSQTIVIADFSYSPAAITARAGEVIRVVNEDDSSHTVTSESGPDAFDDNGAFDSDTINGRSEGSITIPNSASPGDKYYFYCDIHQADMKTVNGTITIAN